MGFSLEIVSPQEKYQRDVNMVIIPGVEGDFGVLAGHTHFITGVKSGKLRVVDKNFDAYYSIDFGLVEVKPHKVTVITEKFSKLKN
ncbi:MAG: F0F1 ATP synthase subunit epsilon [Tepidanaerobacteraceae bacterium]|nr:F0F1 ATP synthase subunit epsilon [Tepidanaerobacteraceae bacterium]